MGPHAERPVERRGFDRSSYQRKVLDAFGRLSAWKLLTPENSLGREVCDMSKRIFEGVNVVELGELAAAPYCGKLLADLGADVVKVEPPLVGDKARTRGPFLGDVPNSEQSGLFLYANTNKRSVTLNFDTLSGKEILLQLLKNADVLIEDREPGELDKAGLGYETLRAINPRLIMVSITPFGQSGPYKNYKAYPLNTFHAGGEGYTLPGGLGYATYPDREPIKIAGYFGEYVAGLTAAIGAACALYGRDAIESGQHIDISKQEALMALSRVVLARYPNEGFVETRSVRELPIGGLMPCKDGFAVVMAFEARMWEGLVEIMGRPAWTQEERYKNAESRVALKKEVNGLVIEWLKTHTKDEVYHQAQAHDCAVGPVYTIGEAINSAQTRVQGFMADVQHPVAGKFAYPTAGYHYSQTPVSFKKPAPLLGQHNEEVYSGRLGISKTEMVELRLAGVI